MQRYEYRVCQVQNGRVTFMNLVWQGQVPLAQGDPAAALQSCPDEYAYLNTAGSDGWQLAAVTGGIGGDPNARILYLRRDGR